MAAVMCLGSGLGPLPCPQAHAQFSGFSVTPENAALYGKVPEIENQLYGHAYGNQPFNRRIDRIERTLFGGTQRGAMALRVEKIDQRMQEKNLQKTLTAQEPLIEYLEEKLFQRTYPNYPLTERVRRLEVQVFGHSFERYPVSVRIKKLSYAMPIVAKEIRLTKSTSEGETVVASTRKVSRISPRAVRKLDMVQLDATQNESSRPVATDTPLSVGDYNQSIYRESNGTVVRWTNLPVHVFIKADAPEYGLSLQAISAWQGSFSVKLVEHSAAADVIVTWDRATWDQNTSGLLTRPVVQVNDRHSIRTVILISMFPTRELPTADQLHVLSHQLGHAFGIWGHSENPGDIMHPALPQEVNDFPSRWGWRSANLHRRIEPSGVIGEHVPSQRDINTLLKLYDQPFTDLSAYSPY